MEIFSKAWGCFLSVPSARFLRLPHFQQTVSYRYRGFTAFLYVRTHSGTSIPVGTLANSKLRKLRYQAHHYFNQLYCSGLMSKQEAYLWLAELLQIPPSEAHIGLLGEYYCGEVIKESKRLLAQGNRMHAAESHFSEGGAAS